MSGTPILRESHNSRGDGTYEPRQPIEVGNLGNFRAVSWNGARRMNTRLRIWKCLKWGGAAITLLLAIMWIGSGWWMWVWTFPSGRIVNVIHGSVRVGGLGKPLKSPTLALRREVIAPSFFPWGIRGGGDWRASWTVYIPMWMPVSLALFITVVGWRRELRARRALRMQCPKCGYDRTGLAATAVCPECGAPSP